MRLLKWTMYLLAMCIVLIIVAEFVGKVNGHPDTILQFDSCILPCWRGIQPGKTTLQEAETLLHTDKEVTNIHTEQLQDQFGNPQYQLCWNMIADPDWQGCAVQNEYMPNYDTIAHIDFTPPSNILRLGDAIRIFGKPIFGKACIPLSNSEGDTIMTESAVGFDHDVTITIVDGTQWPHQFTPAMSVTMISYLDPSLGGAMVPLPWVGFKTDRFACLN